MAHAGMELAGRYVLGERLGGGGMGDVWRGTDQILDRPVAVKMMRNRVIEPEQAARFIREARLSARLQHPGIAVVHDVGTDDGQLFIVMELLHGHDLAAVIREAPRGLPTERAVMLTIQAAEALQAAHEAHVIHRDLKPANLFLLSAGQLKICDFGLAKATDMASFSYSSPGQIMGTPLYMSPEQWLGRGVDGRSDLYSLGCVLYELLTGRPPFTGDEWPAIMNQHMNVAPASLRAIRPDVPKSLDDLVIRLLAKRPADRPQQSSRVAAALQAITSPAAQGYPPKTLPPARPRHAAPVALSTPPLLQRAQNEIKRLLGEAVNAAQQTTTPDSKAQLLIGAGRLLTAADSARAAGLFDEAERLARSTPYPVQRDDVLAKLAAALAATDSSRAESLAQQLTTASCKSEALISIAVTLITVDRDRAMRLLDDAEKAARSFTDPDYRSSELLEVAVALTAFDRNRAVRLFGEAERLTHSITGAGRGAALNRLARQVAATDVARAIRLLDEAAQFPTAAFSTVMAIVGISKALTAVDPDRAAGMLDAAERLAQSQQGEYLYDASLQEVAAALAGTDIDRSIRLAQSIPRQFPQIEALSRISQAIITEHPDRAGRLLKDAEVLAPMLTDHYLRGAALLGIADTWSYAR